MSEAEIAAQLDQDGFVLVPRLFSITTTDQLIAGLAEVDVARSERAGDTYGARNLLSLPFVRQTAKSEALRALLIATTANDVRAVRAIYFDKTPKANWPVAWHQDLSLALLERRDLVGWNNWTIKRGIPHVQAPVHILQRMVTARVHLDDSPVENGALRVIPGSHRHGILPRDRIVGLAKSEDSIVSAQAGDVMLMKPLLLHASSPARNPSHRRVLHLEFAPANLLPEELNWAEVA